MLERELGDPRVDDDRDAVRVRAAAGAPRALSKALMGQCVASGRNSASATPAIITAACSGCRRRYCHARKKLGTGGLRFVELGEINHAILGPMAVNVNASFIDKTNVSAIF